MTMNRLRDRKIKGQSLLEFALITPLLLALIFGIIEFSRIFAAWLAVQNAARWGVRYAVTGGFNDNADTAIRDYCYEALQFYLNHNADGVGPGAGLVPSAAEDVAYNAVISANDEGYDCEIPRSITDGEDKTSALQNYARLRSVYDETLAGALVTQGQLTNTVSGTLVTQLAGALVNANIGVSKDYRAALNAPAVGTFSPLTNVYGDPSAPGYLDISICNSASEYDESVVYPLTDVTPATGQTHTRIAVCTERRAIPPSTWITPVIPASRSWSR